MTFVIIIFVPELLNFLQDKIGDGDDEYYEDYTDIDEDNDGDDNESVDEDENDDSNIADD